LQWLLDLETTTDDATNAVSKTIEPSWFVEDQATKALTGADFVDWRDAPESRCLLVTAPPGSGKSVLSNFVTAHLETRTADGKREKIIYYFCNVRVPVSERSAEAIVRALIVQLCKERGNLIALLPLRFEKDADAFHKAQLSELWGVFSLMMRRDKSSHIFCVIDGLDVYGDCMVELVKKLLSLFSSLEPEPTQRKKLLCTTRPDSGIIEAWEGHLNRQLRPNESDLRTYIETRTTSLKRFNDRMREAARSTLMKDFEDSRHANRVAPTFLWISMAIRKLEQMRYPNVADVTAEIDNSSRDLDALFEQMIVTASERARTNAVMLAWIIYAQQPLTLTELQEAIAIDPSYEYASYDQLEDRRPMLSWSSVHQEIGVLVDNIEGRLFVIHQSVQDFTKRTKILERWISPEPRLFLGDSCIRYLLLCTAEEWRNQGNPDKTSLDSNLSLESLKMLTHTRVDGRIFPLRDLSKGWYQYIETAREGHERLPMIRAITRLQAYLNSFEVIPSCLWWVEDATHTPNEPTGLPRFLCANDLDWMAELVFEGQLGSPEALLCDSVLAYAARNCDRLFRSLMEKWPSRRSRDMQALAKLTASNWCSGKEAVQLLLEDKTDNVHVTSDVVIAAAGNGGSGEEVMSLLLEERPGEVKITPDVITAAAGNGRGVMHLLLQKRPDDVHITPEVIIAAASSYNGREVMQLLLQERPDDVHITSEVVVSAAGNSEDGGGVLQLLLQKRPDDVHITPEVIVAVARNYHGRGVMQLLLKMRPDDVHVTPEVVVAAAGNSGSGKEVMQLLLQEKPEDVYLTPKAVLAVAKNINGGRDVVELFLKRQQLDLSSIDEYGRTPFLLAILRGNRTVLDVFFLLDDHRNDSTQVTFRDKLGCSMIHFAAMGDCVDLIEKTSDFDRRVHAVDNQGWTALHWAAYFGHKNAAVIRPRNSQPVFGGLVDELVRLGIRQPVG
jgi:hypothetical protein